MDLSGTWRAALADDDLRRTAFALDFDDDGWEPIEVPGHWRSRRRPSPTATARSSTAPASSSRPAPRAPATGSCSTASSTRATSGSTAPTSATRRATSSPTPTRSPSWPASAPSTCSPSRSPARRPRDRTKKRTITGVFQHWDSLDPTWNPGGLWRPVRVERTGPVRIGRLRVLCPEADAERAQLQLRAELDSDDGPHRAHPHDGRRPGRAGARAPAWPRGSNQVEWSFGVDSPDAVVAVVARRPAAVAR